jgi:hypothetical protein
VVVVVVVGGSYFRLLHSPLLKLGSPDAAPGWELARREAAQRSAVGSSCGRSMGEWSYRGVDGGGEVGEQVTGDAHPATNDDRLIPGARVS